MDRWRNSSFQRKNNARGAEEAEALLLLIVQRRRRLVGRCGKVALLINRRPRRGGGAGAGAGAGGLFGCSVCHGELELRVGAVEFAASDFGSVETEHFVGGVVV